VVIDAAMWVDPKSEFGLAKNRGKLFSNAMTLREINNSDWEGMGLPKCKGSGVFQACVSPVESGEWDLLRG
jgi:hypothetical protein